MPRKKSTTATLNTPGTDASTDFADQTPSTFQDGKPLPKLFVFDLDYTLWPFWIDTHVTPPLRPDGHNHTSMLDATGERFTFYRQVPGILAALRSRGISIGLASRTHTPDLAGTLLKYIRIPAPHANAEGEGEKVESASASMSVSESVPAWEFFKYREIYPGSKVTHFSKIHSATKKTEHVAFEDMIFFDDESRNKDVQKKHGVLFVLVRDGVTRNEIDKGVRMWRERKGNVDDGGDDGDLDGLESELLSV